MRYDATDVLLSVVISGLALTNLNLIFILDLIQFLAFPDIALS
jgi:hypothetical protein